MSIQIVHHQMNLLGSGTDLFCQPAYEPNKIRLGATGCHLRLAVSSLWLDRQEDVARAGAPVFVILLSWRTRPGRNRCPGLLQKLLAFLIHADHWFLSPIWPCIKLQQIIHPLSILRGDFANTPHQLAPRLAVVFFRNRRMLSRLMFLSLGRRRANLVSNRIVQRLAPFGGALQAKATTSAC